MKGGEKTLKDFHAEVRSWSKLVKDQDAASVYHGVSAGGNRRRGCRREKRNEKGGCCITLY